MYLSLVYVSFLTSYQRRASPRFSMCPLWSYVWFGVRALVLLQAYLQEVKNLRNTRRQQVGLVGMMSRWWWLLRRNSCSLIDRHLKNLYLYMLRGCCCRLLIRRSTMHSLLRHFNYLNKSKQAVKKNSMLISKETRIPQLLPAQASHRGSWSCWSCLPTTWWSSRIWPWCGSCIVSTMMVMLHCWSFSAKTRANAMSSSFRLRSFPSNSSSQSCTFYAFWRLIASCCSWHAPTLPCHQSWWCPFSTSSASFLAFPNGTSTNHDCVSSTGSWLYGRLPG